MNLQRLFTSYNHQLTLVKSQKLSNDKPQIAVSLSIDKQNEYEKKYSNKFNRNRNDEFDLKELQTNEIMECASSKPDEKQSEEQEKINDILVDSSSSASSITENHTDLVENGVAHMDL